MTAVTIRGVTIRAGAGPKFPKLGMLEANTKIMVHSCDGMWCGVLLHGHKAYIEEAGLKLPEGSPSIFDRWGQLLVTNDSPGHQGQPLPVTTSPDATNDNMSPGGAAGPH